MELPVNMENGVSPKTVLITKRLVFRRRSKPVSTKRKKKKNIDKEGQQKYEKYQVDCPPNRFS